MSLWESSFESNHLCSPLILILMITSKVDLCLLFAASHFIFSWPLYTTQISTSTWHAVGICFINTPARVDSLNFPGHNTWADQMLIIRSTDLRHEGKRGTIRSNDLLSESKARRAQRGRGMEDARQREEVGKLIKIPREPARRWVNAASGSSKGSTWRGRSSQAATLKPLRSASSRTSRCWSVWERCTNYLWGLFAACRGGALLMRNTY